MAAIKFVQDLGEDVFSEPKQSATLAYASMVLATTPIDSTTSCVITVSCYSISPPENSPQIFLFLFPPLQSFCLVVETKNFSGSYVTNYSDELKFSQVGHTLNEILQLLLYSTSKEESIVIVINCPVFGLVAKVICKAPDAISRRFEMYL